MLHHLLSLALLASCLVQPGNRIIQEADEKANAEQVAESELWIILCHLQESDATYRETMEKCDILRERLWRLDRDRPAEDRPTARQKADEVIRTVAQEVATVRRTVLKKQAEFVRKNLPADPVLIPPTDPEPAERPFVKKPKTDAEILEKQVTQFEARLQRINPDYQDALQRRDQLVKRRMELAESLQGMQTPSNAKEMAERLSRADVAIQAVRQEIRDLETTLVLRLLQRLQEKNDSLGMDRLLRKYLSEDERKKAG